MARKFFYVCAGMLMLALAYHLGASTAHGQGAGSVLDADDPGLGSYVVTSSGRVYFALYGTNLAPAPRWTPKGTILSVAPIVRIQGAGTGPTGIDVVHAFDADGNFYVSADGGATWVRRGNVFGAPTPALNSSWGQVKARYAPSTAAPTSETNDR